jgi:hypothetical protein
MIFHYQKHTVLNYSIMGLVMIAASGKNSPITAHKQNLTNGR